MKLNARVIGIQAVSGAHDGKRRVEIKPAGSYGSIIVPSDDLREDEELTLLLMTKINAGSLYEFLKEASSDYALPRVLASLLDQLRPDPPPPFLELKAGDHLDIHRPQPDAADTQEFRLGGTV